MEKDYTYLNKIYKKMLTEAEDIIRSKQEYENSCLENGECAGCLAAYVRGRNDDELSYAEGDLLMLDLRHEINKKYNNFVIN